MIEAELAKQWAALPDLPARLESWTWFRSAVGECLARSAQRRQFKCELRSSDLAEAFFRWAGHLDSSHAFARVDPVDYAHYACGALLGSLMQAQPVSVAGQPATGSAPAQDGLEPLKWPEDLVLLCLSLTFLEAWRLHLGAQPLAINPELIHRHWNSFHENAREDSASAVSFLDLFLGLQPVWEYPMTVGNRPAMSRAQARRQMA